MCEPVVVGFPVHSITVSSRSQVSRQMFLTACWFVTKYLMWASLQGPRWVMPKPTGTLGFVSLPCQDGGLASMRSSIRTAGGDSTDPINHSFLLWCYLWATDGRDIWVGREMESASMQEFYLWEPMWSTNLQSGPLSGLSVHAQMLTDGLVQQLCFCLVTEPLHLSVLSPLNFFFFSL